MTGSGDRSHSALESKLISHVGLGKDLDLAELNIPENEREIRADVIRDLLVGTTGATADPRGIHLKHATIVGELDLRWVVSALPLVLVNCRLTAAFIIADAQLKSLDLTGTEITIAKGAGRAIHGSRLKLEGNLRFDRLKIKTADEKASVDLAGARIGGQIRAFGAEILNEKGPALACDQMVLSGGLRFDDNFVAEGAGASGAVRLSGARIDGQVRLGSAELRNDNGPALIADALSVGSDLFFHGGFRATGHWSGGAVRLLGGQIGGQLNLGDSVIANNCGAALVADGLTVGNSLFLQSAQISGDRAGVRLFRVKIAGRLYLNPDAWDKDRPIELEGLTYSGCPSSAPPAKPWGPGEVKKWIALLEHGTPSYSAQPYQQLAEACRADGHLYDQRRILIAQIDDRRKRVIGPRQAVPKRTKFVYWLRRTGLALSRAVTGYGYRPWYAAAWLLLIVSSSIGLASLAAHNQSDHHLLASIPASSKTGSPNACRWADQIGLGLRISVPFLGNVAEGNCQVDTASDAGGLYSIVAISLEALSWATATLAVAGYTGIIRKD